MAGFKITREIIEKSPGPSKCVSWTQSYVGKGLKRMEIRSVTSESDYENEMYVRYSEDNGRTFSEPVPWHYDNGEIFYSPASISRFFRSTKNGKAYWFGNITGPEAYGNSPRYTLIMAEVDEETGFLKKETYTLVDDRNPETESEELQLSNFSLLEDRETKSIELYLTKLEAYREDRWRGDAYRYTIEVD
ncbi:MAG: hypothetical protein QXO76_02135 [Thermoproteota archaeon]